MKAKIWSGVIALCVTVAVVFWTQRPISHIVQDLPAFTSQSEVITGGLPEPDKKPNAVTPGKLEQPEAPQTNAPEQQSPLISANTAPITPVGEIAEKLKERNNQIDKLEKAITEQVRDDDFLASTQKKIASAAAFATESFAKLQPRLKDINDQIEKLGPEPKDGEPPDTDEIRTERERVTKAKSAVDGAIKAAELLQERARQLAGKTLDLRQRIFADAVLAQGQSPLSPTLWLNVAKELPTAGTQLVSLFSQWGRELADGWMKAAGILALAIIVFQLLRMLMMRARSRGLRRANGDEPKTFFQRALAASWVAASLLLPGLLTTLVVYFGLKFADLLPLQIKDLAAVTAVAVSIVLLVRALAYAILQPNRPAWRLFDVPPGSTQRLVTLFVWLSAIYAIDLILQHVMQTMFLPLPVRVAEAALVTLAFATLLFRFVQTPLVGEAKTSPELEGLPAETLVSPMAPRWLKWPALGVAVGITAAALLGYVALGRFVAGQVTVVGGLIVVGMLLWLAIRALTAETGELAERPLERGLRRHFMMNQSQARLLTRTASVALQIALPFAAVPVLFMSWGYSLSDAISWLRSLLFGFQVGAFKISLVHLMIAAGLFVAILFITRLLQRWLSGRVLQPGRLDHGIANSIQTGVGYLGFVLAALAAVSYAGFDITNLAIVAGALSIGIGFGLQSIVNNFVSGLIILFERPIKVGDWVLVNNYEGYVRRISVRSTELETFDRTNVIVPNSEFISNPIVNLTHRNAMGRVQIPIGVSYSSDPEFVQSLLEETTKACPDVLDTPAPLVSFDDFGASSLDFTVRAYIDDVNTRLRIATALRMRIFKALADAGVEIPFPQQDIHLRESKPIREILEKFPPKSLSS